VRYLEDQIREAGCRRIELGVFEFNQRACRLYRKLGYREIGRIDDFTYWKGTMWQDIRMEKYLLD
jgi:RimJ/RimL family protein N-acetyltransferase